ncbi:hypothetical protein JI58_04825 [Marinosulfonomonas sp. PRT-SC04]|nr:hypothetical protein JI58_04825 [Marinosulfonomonas sp. PRT-SC04]
MTTAAAFRRKSAELAGALPPLLAEAERLAAMVLLGEHGRRHSGNGDEFWQYRVAVDGDEARQIDWRRSARSDVHFIRQKEWQAAQSVMLWVDQSASMQFSSAKDLVSKATRAQVLGLAIASLLVRGGERVGLSNSANPVRSGQGQLLRMAQELATQVDQVDFGAPEVHGIRPNTRAVFISDFMGNFEAVKVALTGAADRGVKGALLQILDPQEEAFPFDGRTIFESMAGSVRHETLKAGDLRDRYLQRLAERKAALADLAHATGWHYSCHHSNDAGSVALMWLYHALERRR